MSQGTSRLDVGQALRVACGSLWLQRRQLAALSVVPVPLVAVIDLLARPYVGDLDRILSADPGVEWQTGTVVTGQIRDILQMAAWTVLELACYRLFLLGPGSELPGSQMRAIFLSLFAFNVALMALVSGPDLLFGYAGIAGDDSRWLAVRLLLFIGYIYVSIRLIFVFPAISLGWPWDLRQRWAETEGNFWRLLLLVIPVYVLALLLTIVFSGFGLDVGGNRYSSDGLPVLDALARSVVSWAFLLFATAVTAAAVAQVTGMRAAGMTGQGPGPKEIASRFD